MKNSEMSKWFIFFAILAALMLAISPCVVMAGEGKEPPAGVRYSGPPVMASIMGELGEDEDGELVAFVWGTVTRINTKESLDIGEDDRILLPRDPAVTFETLSAKDLKGYEFQNLFGDGENYLTWTAHSLVKWMDSGGGEFFSAEVLLLGEKMQ